MLHLLQQQIFLHQQIVALALQLPSLGHVLERQEDLRAVIVFVIELVGVEKQRPLAEVRQLHRHLVVDQGGPVRCDAFEKSKKRGDVPLAAADFAEKPAFGRLRSDLEF